MGFDVFIDSNLKAWVLEVNDSPSMNVNLCKEGAKGLLKWHSEVDSVIKTQVVGDSIKLLHKHSSHEKRAAIDTYKGWHRILP